ncbi:mpv17-like protein isoform X2 [Oratosquilla oratoria]|uniref:mpv17-like protein isoform X2 n=1 Tax=Oratosquilla oratoria TaxID=337810 RepID=UPI003F7713B7
MTSLLRGFQTMVKRYPVTRGMLTYGVLWPTSNLVQQEFDKTREGFDYKETLRFCALGTFAVAPTVYCWIKIAGRLVKGTTLKHAIFKAYLEQILFAPVGQTQFYIGINLLEGKTWEECVKEWKNKLIPTWRCGICRIQEGQHVFTVTMIDWCMLLAPDSNHQFLPGT